MKDFNKFKISLNPKYKVFRIDIYEDDFNFQLIEELNEIFLWLQEHLEVSTLVLSQSSKKILQLKNKEHWSHEDLVRYMFKLKALSNHFLQLPQTVIAHFGLGLGAFALDFFSLADIKIIEKNGKIFFNHLNLGLTPSFSLLQDTYPKNFLKKSILSTAQYTSLEFKKLGFCHEVIDQNLEKILEQYFSLIMNQGFLERIQSKLFFYKYEEDLLHSCSELEKQITDSLKLTQDWSRKDFLPSMEVKKRVQLKVFQGGKH